MADGEVDTRADALSVLETDTVAEIETDPVAVPQPLIVVVNVADDDTERVTVTVTEWLEETETLGVPEPDAVTEPLTDMDAV